MNEKQFLNALKELKTLVFMDNPMAKYSIHHVVKSFNLVSFEGQKRITIDSPFDQSNYVYKIGCTDTGVKDNACEVSMYKTLLRLRQNGTLTDDDMILFPTSELVENDPFVIKNKKILRPDQCNEFQQWMNLSKSMNPTYSIVDFWATFIMTYKDPISQQPVLWNDYIRGSQIIAKMSLASDITMNEPLNFGVHVVGGTLRLAFLDLGSCIPLVANKPICPTCGQGELVYASLNIDPSQIPHTEIRQYSGVYGCTNAGCSDSLQTVPLRLKDNNISYHMRDSVVFDLFMNQITLNPLNSPAYAFLLAADSNYLMPAVGMDKQQFYTLLTQISNNQLQITNEAFKVMYENYVFKTLALLIQNPKSEVALVVIDESHNIKNSIMRGALPYSTYKTNMYQILSKYGITGENMVCKISSITYLSLVVQFVKSSNPGTSFYEYFDLDAQTFLNVSSALVNMYGQQDIATLQQQLHL